MTSTSTSSSSSSASSSTHAYAIITTSSALLTRSNSTNSTLNRHSFSPSHDYRRHRHSKSLNSPPALPTPPSTIRTRYSRTRSHTDATSSSSSLSDSGSELGEADTVLHTGSSPVNPDLWDSFQLAIYLRSRGKHYLADLVITNHINGIDFTNLSHHQDRVSIENTTLTLEDIESLAFESRRLSPLTPFRSASLRIRRASFISDESSTDDSFTPKSVSRHRVKSMVAALENAPVSRRLPFPKFSSITDAETKATTHDIALSDAVEPIVTTFDSVDPPIESKHDLQSSANPEEPSLISLLGIDQDASSIAFGAEAWERDIFTATAKKVFPSHDSLGRPVEETKPKLSTMFSGDARVDEILICHDEKISDPTEDAALPDGSLVHPQLPQASPDTLRKLKERVAELEEKIKSLEMKDEEEDGITGLDDYDLSQYFLMATVGVCALVGQNILKRLWANF